MPSEADSDLVVDPVEPPIPPKTPDVDHDTASDADVGSENLPDPMPALRLPLVYAGVQFSASRAFDKDGVTVKCEQHKNCKKWRGLIPANTSVHGDWEAIAFLLAWLREGEKYAGKEASPHVTGPIRPVLVERAYNELLDTFAP